LTINVQPAVPERGVGSGDDARSAFAGCLAKGRLGRLGPPAPGVAKPKRGQEVKPSGFRAPVCHGDADAEVLGRYLGVLDEDIEVSIVSEDAAVDQLVLPLRARA